MGITTVSSIVSTNSAAATTHSAKVFERRHMSPGICGEWVGRRGKIRAGWRVVCSRLAGHRPGRRKAGLIGMTADSTAGPSAAEVATDQLPLPAVQPTPLLPRIPNEGRRQGNGGGPGLALGMKGVVEKNGERLGRAKAGSVGVQWWHPGSVLQYQV